MIATLLTLLLSVSLSSVSLSAASLQQQGGGGGDVDDLEPEELRAALDALAELQAQADAAAAEQDDMADDEQADDAQDAADEDAAAAAAGDAEVVPGTLLWLEVEGLMGVGRPFACHLRVQGDGEVWLPLVGAAEVGGMSVPDAETAVARKYQALANRPLQGLVMLSVAERADEASVPPGPMNEGDFVLLTASDLGSTGSMHDYVLRVAADGSLALPLVGRADVAGASDVDVAELFVRKLKAADIMRRAPIVVVRRISPAEAAQRRRAQEMLQQMPVPVAAGN